MKKSIKGYGLVDEKGKFIMPYGDQMYVFKSVRGVKRSYHFEGYERIIPVEIRPLKVTKKKS